MQRISSLLIARLAGPICVHPCGGIAAGEEAHQKRLTAERFQPILDLTKNALCDVVGEDHLAVGLVGGHGGVVGEGEVEGGLQDFQEGDVGDGLLCAFPYAKDEKTFDLCHPKTSVCESAALCVVF